MKKIILLSLFSSCFMANAQVGIEPFAPLITGTYIGNFNIPVLTDIVVAMTYTDEGDITTNDFVSDDGLTIYGFAAGATGNYCAAGVDAGETMTLVSPVMDFGANTLNPTMTFKWGQGRDFGGFDPNGYGIQYFEVLYKESAGGPWVVAATITTLDLTDIWHTQVVDLSGASSYSTFYIGLRVYCTGVGVFVSYGKTVWDEIVVTGEPSCSGSTGAATISACDTYTVPSGDETYTTSGIKKDTLPSASGCDSVITINLTINTSPNILFSSFQDTICNNGGSINLPVATPGAGTFSGLGVAGTMFNPSLATIGINYIVYDVTDGNGCSDSDSVSIVVDNCSAINELDNNKLANIYPNPALNAFTIDLANTIGETSIEICSADGKLVYNQRVFNVTQQLIDANNWNKGIYFIKISNNNFIQNSKLIKQ